MELSHLSDEEQAVIAAMRSDEVTHDRVLMAADLLASALTPAALRIARQVALGQISDAAAAALLEDDAPLVETAEWADAVRRFAEQGTLAAKTTPEWGVMHARANAQSERATPDEARRNINDAVRLAKEEQR